MKNWDKNHIFSWIYDWNQLKRHWRFQTFLHSSLIPAVCLFHALFFILFLYKFFSCISLNDHQRSIHGPTRGHGVTGIYPGAEGWRRGLLWWSLHAITWSQKNTPSHLKDDSETINPWRSSWDCGGTWRKLTHDGGFMSHIWPWSSLKSTERVSEDSVLYISWTLAVLEEVSLKIWDSFLQHLTENSASLWTESELKKVKSGSNRGFLGWWKPPDPPPASSFRFLPSPHHRWHKRLVSEQHLFQDLFLQETRRRREAGDVNVFQQLQRVSVGVCLWMNWSDSGFSPPTASEGRPEESPAGLSHRHFTHSDSYGATRRSDPERSFEARNISAAVSVSDECREI